MDLKYRLRALRKERGFSLEQLADKSGVALATLSRIENGKGAGTFRTHQRIAEAFDLPITELYRGLEETEQEAVFLESEAFDEVETFVYDEKASAILLARQVARKQMLPQMIILQTEGKTAVEQYKYGTERWLFVLEGSLAVSVGIKTYQLGKGGTLYFKASIRHSLTNTGPGLAKVISVTSPVAL